MRVRKVVPLVFHRIVPDGMENQFEDVGISMLRRILEACQYRCISVEGEGEPKDLLEQHFLLTFDDGHLSDFEITLPLLMQMDCTATFFMITEKIGTPGFLSWPHVRELHNAGMTIGSHSVSHPDMRQLSISRQREELFSSRLHIEDKLGSAVTTFSFPFGKFNMDLVKLAWDAGYSTVCTSKHGVTQIPAPLLPRNSINRSMDWESVSQTLKAAPLTRLKWIGEDLAKSAVQRLMGDGGYRTLRGIWVKRGE